MSDAPGTAFPLSPSLEARFTRAAEVGIVPCDNETMVDWYRNALRLTVHSDTDTPVGVNRRHLVGDAILKLLCVTRPPKKRPPSPPEGPCLRSLTLAPDDRGELYERARLLKALVGERSGKGFEAVRLRDPEGNELEIIHYLGRTGGQALQVEVGASDVSRSLVFYRDVLGAPEVEPDAYAPEGTLASISWGEVRLNLTPASGPHPSPGGNTLDAGGIRYLTAIIDDAEAATGELLSRGVIFPTMPMLWRGVSMVSFAQDPDGNLIEIASLARRQS